MEQLKWYENYGDENNCTMHRAEVASDDNSVHIVGSLLSLEEGLMVNGTLFVKRARDIVDKNEAVVVGQHVSQFTSDDHDQSGYSAAIILAESHITIHTWPELNMAELDVYLCNVLQNNRLKCRNIFKGIVSEFKPSKTAFVEVPRPNLAQIALSNTALVGAGNAA